MDVQTFWNVIGQYNQNTIIIQVMLLILTVIALSLSYTNKVACLAKLMLGIANLFIGIMFFGYYGTQPIQKYFAFPLYLICGFLFLYECLHNKNDILERPNLFQIILLLLLTIWGLTGIKSVIFAAYEDIILLICGIYGLYLLAKEFRLLKLMKVT